ncbi:hypothetical protein GCM10010994_32040 [Chelatococcus reniformis]|uniref:Uncharacterized protein n=1 Tax=Chelatococcus reniformis TaxID=1494448 RepID=A0A916UFK6_9HYPH|nr:hypothetical protein GCM10010994_32040 [Chelatococcus reniformis]
MTWRGVNVSVETYIYELTERVEPSNILVIRVKDDIGIPNTWEERPPSNILIVSKGTVLTDGEGHHCRSGNQEVLVIRGGGWSAGKKSGEAELFLYHNSTPYFDWVLTKVESS